MRIPSVAVSIVLAAAAVAPASVSHARSSEGDPVVLTPASAARIPARTSPTAIRRPAVSVSFAKVVLSEQRAYFFNARRRLVATIPVSTGTEGTTPTGSFRIFSKSESAYYAPDPKEKMRWMTRFTRGSGGGNIGFHSIPYRIIDGTEVPTPTPLGIAPSSHGCIRVSNSDAQWIFDNMAIGTVVTVVASR